MNAQVASVEADMEEVLLVRGEVQPAKELVEISGLELGERLCSVLSLAQDRPRHAWCAEVGRERLCRVLLVGGLGVLLRIGRLGRLELGEIDVELLELGAARGLVGGDDIGGVE